jgi:hypothetical protein
LIETARQMSRHTMRRQNVWRNVWGRHDPSKS